VSVFVDTSIWFAAANSRDHLSVRAKEILSNIDIPVLTDHVLVETWLTLNSKVNRVAAEKFWAAARTGNAEMEKVTFADLEVAWSIGEIFRDQSFSLVDRTSFAVMERLGLTRAASFDSDFAIYRYGRMRERAFEVIR
jgi:predicted nucleic acid-binding protein